MVKRQKPPAQYLGATDIGRAWFLPSCPRLILLILYSDVSPAQMTY